MCIDFVALNCDDNSRHPHTYVCRGRNIYYIVSYALYVYVWEGWEKTRSQPPFLWWTHPWRTAWLSWLLPPWLHFTLLIHLGISIPKQNFEIWFISTGKFMQFVHAKIPRGLLFSFQFRSPFPVSLDVHEKRPLFLQYNGLIRLYLCHLKSINQTAKMLTIIMQSLS